MVPSTYVPTSQSIPRPRKRSGTQVAKKLGGWEWGGAGVALALNPLVYWEWCRMAMFVGLWTDRTIVKHMLESPKNNSWAGLVKLVISTSLANYRVNQLVWHIPVKTCIQFLIWIVVNVVHFHWIDDAELFASSTTDGHCNWEQQGLATAPTIFFWLMSANWGHSASFSGLSFNVFN